MTVQTHVHPMSIKALVTSSFLLLLVRHLFLVAMHLFLVATSDSVKYLMHLKYVFIMEFTNNMVVVEDLNLMVVRGSICNFDVTTEVDVPAPDGDVPAPDSVLRSQLWHLTESPKTTREETCEVGCCVHIISLFQNLIECSHVFLCSPCATCHIS